MKGLKIIEYHSCNANEVARMWRISSKGWNGCFSNITEEQVLSEQSKRISSNTLLAVKNNEVLGYCYLKDYGEDEGALEIKLLNVRFDYRGWSSLPGWQIPSPYLYIRVAAFFLKMMEVHI